MTAEMIRADLEQTLSQLKHQDPDCEYVLVHPIERKFNTWILDHPPMDMPVNEEVVQTSPGWRRSARGTTMGGESWPLTQTPTRCD